jgi:phage tail-like protein
MSGEKQDNIWPLPKFFFSVKITGLGDNLPFQEVNGLDTEAEPITYRAGNSKSWNVIKMPGLIKTGNVTLKKGIFVNDNNFWNWYKQIQLNTIKRQTVTISLLDQNAKSTMSWTLTNAWPTKITGTDLKSDGNEVAVETLEICHERLTIANAS